VFLLQTQFGWSLRRIEEATEVRRETASAYLKTAGIRAEGAGGRSGLACRPGWGPAAGGSHVIGRDRSILKCRCGHYGEELCST
jgi:hypothetical protein